MNTNFICLDVTNDPVHYDKQEVILTEQQKKALEYANKKARIFSKNVKDNLEIRFIELGYNKCLVEQVLLYIKNIMPLVIHVSLHKHIDNLIKDTHYRSAFETTNKNTKSYLNYRLTKENKIFNNIYTNDSERVKYGAINITTNPHGVECALIYGESYLLLKNKVKERISFVFGNSEQDTPHLQTIEHCNNILLYISDNILHSIIRNMQNSNIDIDTKYNQYIEIQIHGDIILSRDIKALVVGKDYNNIDKLEEFKKTHNIEYYFASDYSKIKNLIYG